MPIDCTCVICNRPWDSSITVFKGHGKSADGSVYDICDDCYDVLYWDEVCDIPDNATMMCVIRAAAKARSVQTNA